jgi:dolichol-phosphate mannosyltransferase
MAAVESEARHGAGGRKNGEGDRPSPLQGLGLYREIGRFRNAAPRRGPFAGDTRAPFQSEEGPRSRAMREWRSAVRRDASRTIRSAGSAIRQALATVVHAALPLSVIVPVRNEEENILPLLAEIDAALEGRLEYEVIYVDDGSSDGTPAMLATARQRYPRLRVLTHEHSCGQSAAMWSGVRAARGEWIGTLDGDGQNDPDDLTRLIAVRDAADSPPDLRLIAGYRKSRRDSALKILSSRIANGVRSRLLGDATPDTGCGIKLIARETYLDLPFFDHMHRFLPALVQRQGGATISVEVRHRPRLRGRSNYGVHNRLWVGLVDLCGVMWLQRRMRSACVREAER